MVSRTKKFRGSRTHGRGKKHGRGYGDRGGRGNAGLHKHKFKWMLKYAPDHFGRHGFTRHHDGEKKPKSINVAEVQARIAELMEYGVAIKGETGFTIDLGKAGYQKLLGGGRTTIPLRITVARATDAARTKVQSAGGTVTTEATSG